MGFTGPAKNRMVEDLELERDERGLIRRDAEHRTSVPELFVTGDMAMGQSLVVWAIADGRGAAEGIRRYLERMERGT
jgi:glutamate synthase (NADPH/NADH) small chain